MGQDDRRRVHFQHPSYDLARMHRGRIQSPEEQGLERNQLVARVEEQAGKDLASQALELRNDEILGALWPADRLALLERGPEVAPGQLQSRLQFRVPRRAQTGQRQKRGQGQFKQLAQAAAACQQFTRERERVAPAAAGTEKNRQQLGIRERQRAAVEEPFPGPLGGRRVFNRHGNILVQVSEPV